MEGRWLADHWALQSQCMISAWATARDPLIASKRNISTDLAAVSMRSVIRVHVDDGRPLEMACIGEG